MLRLIWHLLHGLLLLIAVHGLPANSQAKDLLTFDDYTSAKPNTVMQQLRPILNLSEHSIAVDFVKIEVEVVREVGADVELHLPRTVNLKNLGPAWNVHVKRDNPA